MTLKNIRQAYHFRYVIQIIKQNVIKQNDKYISQASNQYFLLVSCKY